MSAIKALSPEIQKWVWDKGWRDLRPIQIQAITAILQQKQDLVLAASTSGGKTEAVFLPCLSALQAKQTSENRAEGFQLLYLSPLKSLINDQFQRLETLSEAVSIPVTPWHGDVAQSKKQRRWQKPDGILLMTPESLESLLLRKSHEIPAVFAALDYIVIDELHAFIGSERGIHLMSLLSRLEMLLQRPVRRIGLSATLGDMKIAAKALRRGGEPPEILVENGQQQSQSLTISGFWKKIDGGRTKDEKKQEPLTALYPLAYHLYQHYRQNRHLIFAGSRRNVEIISDQLAQFCEQAKEFCPFFPHHGNLSKEVRESLEQALKTGSQDISAVTTSTLEMGIDIGHIKSIVQVGAPQSISALRQRIGRSGRREGQSQKMALMIEEMPFSANHNILDQLSFETIQAVAALSLLQSGWCETPQGNALHLSTLVHQIFACLKQYGGVKPHQLYHLLCQKGPFQAVSEKLFTDILHCLATTSEDILEQTPHGELILGLKAEKWTDYFDFYSVFQTVREYQMRAKGKSLGTLSASRCPQPGAHIIFSGRRWQVRSVDNSAMKVDLTPANAGVAPSFEAGYAENMSETLVQAMKHIYQNSALPGWCDAKSRLFLEQGRSCFQDQKLSDAPLLVLDQIYLFPWMGTTQLLALWCWFSRYTPKVYMEKIALRLAISETEFRNILKDMLAQDMPKLSDLAKQIKETRTEKFHDYLSDDLLYHEIAEDKLSQKGLDAYLVQISNHLNIPR